MIVLLYHNFIDKAIKLKIFTSVILTIFNHRKELHIMNYTTNALYQTEPVLLGNNPLFTHSTWTFTFDGTHFVNTEVSSFVLDVPTAESYHVRKLFDFADVTTEVFTDYYKTLERGKDYWMLYSDVVMPYVSPSKQSRCVVLKSANPTSNLVLKRLVQEVRYYQDKAKEKEHKLNVYLKHHTTAVPEGYTDVFEYVKSLCTEEEWKNYQL